MAAAMVTALLFAGIPCLFALRSRVRLKTGFRLHVPPAVSFLAAVLLGVSLWPFAHELFLANRLLGMELLDSESMARAGVLLKAWQTIPVWWIVLTLGIAAPVCEEWFFRGYLLASLRGRMPDWQAILIAGLLFGLFHVVTPNVLAIERFLPSGFLGLVLGWVAVRCGSVLPSMLLHAVHNSLLLLASYYSEELAGYGWAQGDVARLHLPWLWLAIALGVALAGIALLHRAGSGRSEQTASSNSYAETA